LPQPATTLSSASAGEEAAAAELLTLEVCTRPTPRQRRQRLSHCMRAVCRDGKVWGGWGRGGERRRRRRRRR
jgi:hypothetical protein